MSNSLQQTPNHALQGTRRERRGCNGTPSWAGSRLGRWRKEQVTRSALAIRSLTLAALPMRAEDFVD
jgi:hypothetical protein